MGTETSPFPLGVQAASGHSQDGGATGITWEVLEALIVAPPTVGLALSLFAPITTLGIKAAWALSPLQLYDLL